MELYQLRTFVAVANESLSSSESERLNACHPSVISHINALEKELGVALFSRKDTGLEVSADGIVLMAEAQNVLAEADCFMRKARSLHAEVSGAIKLGIIAEAQLFATQDLVEHIKLSHPHLEMIFERGTSEQILGEICSGGLAGGYVVGQNLSPEELVFLKIVQQKLVVVGPRQWQDEVDLADWPQLAALPWIWSSHDSPRRSLLEEAFSDRELIATAAAYVEDEDAMKAHVIAGAGMSLLPESEALTAVEAGDLCIWHKEAFYVDLFFAYVKGGEGDPLLEAVLDAIKEVRDF
nr:LysR family transcriptional regulator [Desulfobulbaceae bacterium]